MDEQQNFDELSFIICATQETGMSSILSAAGIDPRRFSFFDAGVRILDLEERKASFEERQAAADIRRKDRLRRAAEKKKVRTIGVMGNFEWGITTLVNALLEADLLPTDVLPTTAMITTVKYDATVEACLIGKDGKAEEIPIEALSKYICSGQVLGRTDDREAIVCFPSEFLKSGVEIVDTPGLNNSEELTEISESSIYRFDMVLMVLYALSPLTLFEREFVPKLLEKVDLKQIVFVINKIDLIEAEDREAVEKCWKEEIGLFIENTAKPHLVEIYGEEEADQICGGDINLFFVSAKRALKGEETYRDGILQLKETLTALLKSGD